jgi:hypothetical protein
MNNADLKTWSLFRKNLQDHVDEIWKQRGKREKRIIITAPMVFIYIQTGFKGGPVQKDPRTDAEVHAGVVDGLVRDLKDNVYGSIEQVEPERHPFLDRLAALPIFGKANNSEWTRREILDSFEGWTEMDTSAVLSEHEGWNIFHKCTDGRWVRDYEVMLPEDRPDK